MKLRWMWLYVVVLLAVDALIWHNNVAVRNFCIGTALAHLVYFVGACIWDLIKRRRLRRITAAKDFVSEHMRETLNLTYYIKVGYQDPTTLVAVGTIFGEERYILSTVNLGVVSLSELVKVLKAFLELESPLTFVVSPMESNLLKYLQDNGIDNVVIASKEDWKVIMEEPKGVKKV